MAFVFPFGAIFLVVAFAGRIHEFAPFVGVVDFFTHDAAASEEFTFGASLIQSVSVTVGKDTVQDADEGRTEEAEATHVIAEDAGDMQALPVFNLVSGPVGCQGAMGIGERFGGCRDYDSYEPFLSNQTTAEHHLGIHQTYVDELNAAVQAIGDGPQWDGVVGLVSREIVRQISVVAPTVADARSLRNFGGGNLNHLQFWQVLSPAAQSVPASLQEAARRGGKYADIEALIADMKDQAAGLFGNGWVWVVVESTGNLRVCTTESEDNPWMEFDDIDCKGQAIMGLDLWEHAYYLDYQNDRAAYVDAFFDGHVNWDFVSDALANADSLLLAGQ